MSESIAEADKPLGFWACWSLCVGCMIGSGVFMLPALLAPYGLLSFVNWIIAGAGSIALAIVFGRLASRTTRDGGPYVYVQESFGDLAGFLVAWSYWISFMIGIPIVAIAFVGYLGVFFPWIAAHAIGQELAALGLIAVLTFINVRGLKEMSFTQILMTILKIIPLLVIVGLAVAFGKVDNLPSFNPSGAPVLTALTTVALIMLWPFTGFEVTTLPAGNVRDAERTIPRALIIGMLTVTAIYLSATTAVMLLVPPDMLAHSTAPFSDAARPLGAWGAPLVAIGALVATAGTLNGLIFTCGQMPMALAEAGFAPKALAKLNAGGAPYLPLIGSSVLGGLLLLANYSRGLLGAFTFLVMMSTAISLFYYFLCSLAELRHSWRSATGWAGVALVAILYSLFAIFGSGFEVLAWGIVAMLCGVPLFYLMRQRDKPAPAPLTRPS